MRGHSKPPNAEGSGPPTETEEQTTREGVQGDSTWKKKGVKEHRRRRGVFVGDSETPSSRLIIKLGGGDSDSEKHNLISVIGGACVGQNPKR